MTTPLTVELLGWTIARDALGEWTMTAPASVYGWETVEQMVDVEGFAPEAMPINDAGFANAPFMADILIELCTRLEALSPPPFTPKLPPCGCTSICAGDRCPHLDD